MSTAPLKQFRLRNGQTIVGFMKQVYGGSYFYSKDYHWWTGKEINYKEIDEWTGFHDKNRRPVFEWDIVKYKIDSNQAYRQGAILWQHKNEKFGIRDLKEEFFFPLKAEGLDLFNRDELEIISHLFLNPSILELWGLNDS